MELHVLGSGSSGNCYTLTDKEGRILILECGISFREIKVGIDFKVDNVVGCLITHAHMDHAKSIYEVYKNGIRIATSKGTYSTFPEVNEDYVASHAFPISIGPFTVMPFNAIHNCSEPLSFLIYHPEMGNLAFITDNGRVDVGMKDISHWLLEANYDEDSIAEANIHSRLMRRVQEDHFSIQQAIELLAVNDRSMLKTVTLCHLSEMNGDEYKFKNKVAEKFAIMPKIAKKGLKVCLDR